MNIVLLGYMGCGKTTIGKIISKITGKRFIDLDSYIESTTNQTISNIFSSKGEVYFRKIESDCLKVIMGNYDNVILSLGGGTPCYSNNLNLIKDSKSFYLKYSTTILSNRLINIKSSRPILSNINNIDSMNDYIAKHLFERNYYYNQVSDIIQCDLKSKDEIANEILSLLY
ncbi:MAG: shikimate kinase [Flavobacteriaceae bacterium TMED238]|nr:shikimate kinase [Flavobacteriaceae bacterium]RPG61861.1 MAG: shikimate kinase [Flavobacteriaceae bacterium TMED238]|tara:strand:+ start:142 stop:654 length:513 start_codon:yes stop_codon:yes gene_type:complete